MVAGSAKRIEFIDEALQKNAMEEFYVYQKRTILERPGYNSYTELSAVFGDEAFVKRSEEIVMFALGLSDELKEEQKGKLVYPNGTVKYIGMVRLTLMKQ